MPQWLWDQGVRHAILCPGSRSAPLTLAIARSGLMEIFTGVDERSAGFAALGLSLGAGRPVVVVCTSGTALLNLGPAVAEAYYLRLPLLILSADRPAGYEGQQRGQVIRQDGALDHHLRASLRWAPDEPEWDLLQSEKLFKEALRTAVSECGPVHINIPLDEPLYDIVEQSLSARIHSTLNDNNDFYGTALRGSVPEDLQIAIHQALTQGKKIWFLAGMGGTNKALEARLKELKSLGRVCLWSEDLANLKVSLPIRDEWFRASSVEPPALLISWGGPLVSKHLQLFLRRNPKFKHWRIDPRGDEVNTYNWLDGVWKTSPEFAIEDIHNIIGNISPEIPLPTNQGRADLVSNAGVPVSEASAMRSENSVLDFDRMMRDRYSQIPFSDSLALSVALPFLNQKRVHLGNSSLVRKFLALPWEKDSIKSIHCNRGTSGIEGSISTAIGEAWAHPEDSVWVLNGDLATAYDAGAWLLEPRPSVKIILLNNEGGDIFRQLPGASRQPECEALFATARNLNWSLWSQGYNLPHRLATDLDSLHQGLNWLHDLSGPAVLEIQTSPSGNRQAEIILGQPSEPPQKAS